MANNYILLVNTNITNLHKEAVDLVNKGYIPSGAITQVATKGEFKVNSDNIVDFNSPDKNMRVTFIQSFYKPPTISI